MPAAKSNDSAKPAPRTRAAKPKVDETPVQEVKNDCGDSSCCRKDEFPIAAAVKRNPALAVVAAVVVFIGAMLIAGGIYNLGYANGVISTHNMHSNHMVYGSDSSRYGSDLNQGGMMGDYGYSDGNLYYSNGGGSMMEPGTMMNGSSTNGQDQMIFIDSIPLQK